MTQNIQRATVQTALPYTDATREEILPRLFPDGTDRVNWKYFVRELQHARDPRYATARKMLYEMGILQEEHGVAIFADGIPMSLGEPRHKWTPTYFKDAEDAWECANAKFGGMCCDIRIRDTYVTDLDQIFRK